MKKTTIFLADDIAASMDAVKRLLGISIAAQVSESINEQYKRVYAPKLRRRAKEQIKRGFAQEVVS
jgi:hypothetical protein